MKRHEKYIVQAAQQIKQKLAEPRGSIQVPEVYKGYIASFAGSIRQSGLLAAVYFYTSTTTDEKSTDFRRNQFLNILFQLVKEEADEQASLVEYIIAKAYTNPEVPDTDALDVIQSKIEDVAVAVKLALRSFELIKETT